MATVCIQCAIRYVVEQLEAGNQPGAPPIDDAEPLDHLNRVHPDPAAANREREDLMRRLKKFSDVPGLLDFLLCPPPANIPKH